MYKILFITKRIVNEPVRSFVNLMSQYQVNNFSLLS
jgi:hypothetical protein